MTANRTFREYGGVRLDSVSRARVQAASGDAPYVRNSLVNSPMPSITMLTVLTGSFMTPTPTDVPQQIRSPGSRVMSCEILLTSCCALKIISAMG